MIKIDNLVVKDNHKQQVFTVLKIISIYNNIYYKGMILAMN